MRNTSYTVYRSLGSVPLVLFVGFLLVGDRLDWDVLLVGLGWRAWLLISVFPARLALWTRSPKCT